MRGWIEFNYQPTKTDLLIQDFVRNLVPFGMCVGDRPVCVSVDINGNVTNRQTLLEM
jgi:hypothetical protein